MRSQFRRRNRGIVVVAAVTVLLSVFWLAGSALAAPDEPLCWADWGDLPDGYPTTYAEGGPRHTSPGTPGLGPTVDNEHDTQHDPDALADDDRDSPDDEDGVVRNPAEGWAPSDPVGLDVTIVNADGCLVAWFDWDGDLTLETQYNFGLLPPGAHTLPIPGGVPPATHPATIPSPPGSASTSTTVRTVPLSTPAPHRSARWLVGRSRTTSGATKHRP